MTMTMIRRVCISHVAALALVCAALAGCGTRIFFFQLIKPGEYKASKDNAASLAKKHLGGPIRPASHFGELFRWQNSVRHPARPSAVSSQRSA